MDRMDFLKSILLFLQTPMEVPTPYGWFHITWLVITVVAAVLLCVFHKKDKPERVRLIVLFTALVVIALEIYKQIVWNFSVTDEGIAFSYNWQIFPFQFCSTPMYAGLIAGLTKKGWIHDAFCTYLATYSIFAGLCVMLTVGDVFMYMAGINVQTMVCHGSMIAIGIYLLYSGHIKLEHKTIFKAMAVFASCLTIAVVMNEIAYYTGLLEKSVFNMFFVSPYQPGTLPVYSDIIQPNVPYPWCLIIYIAAFSLAAYLILLAAIGIKALAKRIKNRKEKFYEKA